MNNLSLSFSGADLVRLRTLVATVGAEVAHAAGATPPLATPGPRTALDATWSALVDMLDLGTTPEMRDCPQCGHQGMLGATRCGYCWIQLSPPTAKLPA
jgi:hypothetical protein